MKWELSGDTVVYGNATDSPTGRSQKKHETGFDHAFFEWLMIFGDGGLRDGCPSMATALRQAQGPEEIHSLNML